MEEKTLAEEALSFGWKQAKSRFVFFFMYLVAGGLVMLLLLGLTAGLLLLDGGLKALAALPFLAFCLAAFVFGLTSLNLSLMINKGEKPAFSELWPGASVAFTYLGGCIIYVALVGIGSLLLLVPGIYMAIKYQYFAMFILDEDAGALEAIRRSGKITKGNWLGCFVLVLEIGLLCGLGGLLTLGIGLFWFVPTVLVAYGFAYMKLSGKLAQES